MKSQLMQRQKNETDGVQNLEGGGLENGINPHFLDLQSKFFFILTFILSAVFFTSSSSGFLFICFFFTFISDFLLLQLILELNLLLLL